MLNTTKTRPVPYEKTRYATIPPEKVEGVLEKLQPGSSVQAKLDGAASLTQLFKDHFEVLSYRARKDTGGPIVHTERVFHGRPEVKIPKELVGTVLRGELYGTDPTEEEPLILKKLEDCLIPAWADPCAPKANKAYDYETCSSMSTGLGGGRSATNAVRSLPYASRLDQVRSIMPT
jgi:hypothetical protein